MKNQKVGARYARALLGALPDPALAEAAEALLASLGTAVEQSTELRASLLNPVIPRAARKSALRALLRPFGLPDAVGRFLDVVVENERIREIPAIAAAFRRQREAAQGTVTASVRSASPIPPQQAARLQAALERLSARRVKLSLDVSPSLLGGVVTRIGSRLYDGSLRTQLDLLRRRMVQELPT